MQSRAPARVRRPRARCALQENASVLYHKDLARILRNDPHVMGDEDDGVAVLIEVFDHLHHVALAPHSPGRWSAHPGSGRQAVPPTPRPQPMRCCPLLVRLEGIFLLCALQPHKGQGFADAGFHVRLGQTTQPGSKGDLIEHSFGEDLVVGVLEDVPHALAQLENALFPGRLAVDRDLAAGGEEQAVELPASVVLPLPFLPHDGHDVALEDVKRDAVERLGTPPG